MQGGVEGPSPSNAGVVEAPAAVAAAELSDKTPETPKSSTRRPPPLQDAASKIRDRIEIDLD